MGTVRVTKKAVYSDKQASEEEQQQRVQYGPGELRIPDAINKDIEDSDFRRLIPLGHGEICITVMPGDELGELSFNVQFEGTKGEHEFCLRQQDALYQDVSEWLGQVLAELPADFEAEIEARPCPHPDIRVQVDAGARRLAGQSVRERRSGGGGGVAQTVRRRR